MNFDKRPRVYLDTNAINILCDKFYGKSKRSISLKYEILFSSPSLDELINCGSQMLQSELSDFMWQISNRKILLDLKGLIILEVNALLQNKTLTIENYFDHVFLVWMHGKMPEGE